MTKAARTTEKPRSVLRGIALAFGLLANLPFLFFLIDSGAKAWPKLTWTEPRGIPLFLALTTALVGYLIAWRWVRVGAATIMVSAVATCALVIAGSGGGLALAALMVSVPLFVTGILLLASIRRTRLPRATAMRRDPTTAMVQS